MSKRHVAGRRQTATQPRLLHAGCDGPAPLAGAMLLEQNDEWALNRRYMQLESLQTVSDTALTRMPAVAR